MSSWGSNRISLASEVCWVVGGVKENADVVAAFVGGRNVWFGVAIDVCNGHGIGRCACGKVNCGFKSSIPIACKKADGVDGADNVVIAVCNSKVYFAIAIKICSGNRNWPGTCRSRSCRLECSVAIA